MDNEKNYTAKEFSVLTGVKLRKLYADIRKGLVPHYRVGKTIIIPGSSQKEYLGPLLSKNNCYRK